MGMSRDMYKIKFKCRGWLTTSTRYFTATGTGEAVQDLDYAMQHNMITSNRITIHSVSLYNRYSGRWDKQDLACLESRYSKNYRGKYIIRRD